MSQEDILAFTKKISALLELSRLAIGMTIATVGGVIGMALWVNSTSNAIAQNTSSIAMDRQQGAQFQREFSDWKARKDEIDVRFTVIIENQQRIIDRQESLLNKLNERMERIITAH